MKPRIKTDGWILAIITILTAVFYVLPQIQEKNVVRDNFFDILGILFLLKGIYLRMAARGHKQCHSSKGSGLVTTGVYRYVRNPMYLGTFYIGCGFVLIAWTWWGFPVFCLLFYLRFRGIICSEEKYLLNVFGKKYEEYSKTVPRFFPSLQSAWKVRLNEDLKLEDVWSTKEKWVIFTVPMWAIACETIQQKVVLGYIQIEETLIIVLSAMLIFVLALGYGYLKKL